MWRTDFFQAALGSGLPERRDSPYEWAGMGRVWFSIRAAPAETRPITATQVIDGEDRRLTGLHRTKLWHRTQDAVNYTFVSRRDDGSHGFAYSRVSGASARVVISRAWHPSRLHTFFEGLTSGTLDLGLRPA